MEANQIIIAVITSIILSIIVSFIVLTIISCIRDAHKEIDIMGSCIVY